MPYPDFEETYTDMLRSQPANTGYSSNAVSMLGQRRRQWHNIETALNKYPVFAEHSDLIMSHHAIIMSYLQIRMAYGVNL